MTSVYDAAVIGGGIAGAALGTHLARAGRSVVLLERELGPHDKVCGEFISREGAAYLADLGVDLKSLGSRDIQSVRIAGTGRSVKSALPFRGQSLSRRVLDEALLGLAKASCVEVRRGVRVTALTFSDGVWSAGTGGEGQVLAKAAFLATGKHDLRGWRRPQGPQSDLIGLKCYFQLHDEQSRALQGFVELGLFRGGYAGLQLVEGNRANLCLLVRRSAFAKLASCWDKLLDRITADCPHLQARLSDAIPYSLRPLAISGLPYGHVTALDDGIWRLGDQAAVIPSFSGDGMSIALHTASIAAQCYLHGRSSLDYSRRIASDVSGQVWRATVLSKALVTGWGQCATMAASRAVPHVLSATAALTRIPPQALKRGLIG